MNSSHKLFYNYLATISKKIKLPNPLHRSLSMKNVWDQVSTLTSSESTFCYGWSHLNFETVVNKAL